MAAIRQRPKTAAVLALAAATLIAFACASTLNGPTFHAGCLPSEYASPDSAEFVVCATSDMAKITRFGAITLEHANFDLSTNQSLTLTAARNEVIGFQLIVQRIAKTDNQTQSPSDVSVQASPWIHNAFNEDPTLAPITQYFAAHYHYVDKGGYQWGPKSAVLNWPDEYPDALIPNQGRCAAATTPIFESINLSDEKNANQAIWFDVYVPKQLSTGTYQQTVSLTIDSNTVTVPIDLTVYPAQLPDKPSVHAVGEIYRSYNLEGAGNSLLSPAWQTMSNCYQQLAHQHRTVFFERVVVAPGDPEWDAYLNHIEPVLNGSLFSSDNGYVGPGENTAVGVWRTPWEQEINVQREQKTDTNTLTRITNESTAWQNYVTSINATELDYFAYVFDEVDGPDPTADPDERYDYIASVHDDMDAMQKAIDAGSPNNPRIDLLWTSHSNPSIWQDDPALDLTGKIRLWAPNASAADVPFLKARQAAGDSIWFYHSGHPAIGVHSINASGIEMRTWGMAAARYGFDGQFMWAVNLGSDERPFAEPSYKPDDDRFGNGVMVYPGNQLPKIGYPATPGPLPSMRLKAWRRGLQDAELIQLVRNGANAEAVQTMEAELTTLFPRGLSEGTGKAAWQQSPAAWIDFRASLLRLSELP